MMNKQKIFNRILRFTTVIFIFFQITGCSSYYNLDDFEKANKIDAHVHMLTFNTVFIDYLVGHNFKAITINTDVPYFPSIEKQQEIAVFHKEKHPDDFFFLCTFQADQINNNDWWYNTQDYINNSLSKGASGVKIWKNIGMQIRDTVGNFIMIDNPVFTPLFNFLTINHIPVLGHLGEPKNSWLSIEKMTINSDKEYFSNHPEYHMFLHPEYPSYEIQVEVRDNILKKHPDLIFVGAHLGSLEWSVEELAKRLDKFPNMAVDLTERICHLQFQSIENRDAVRNFFIKYQDRIIYGTDIRVFDSLNKKEFIKNIHNIYTNDWEFFITDNKMSVSRVNGEFTGLKLQKDIIDKIYYKNAIKLYKLNIQQK